MRTACRLVGDEIYWPGAKQKLNPARLPLVQHVGGRRTIRETIELVARAGKVEHRTLLRDFANQLFRALWRLDLLSMALNAGPAG